MKQLPKSPAFASLGIATIATATIVAVAATHPAQAASVLASVASAVTCATTTACVAGTNTGGGPGVEGSAKSSFGVEGVSASGAGVKGVSTSSNGVWAVSSMAAGLLATSSSNYGVYGTTTTGVAGVYGTSAKTSGVAGTSSLSYGVSGTTTTGLAGVYGASAGSNATGAGVYGTSTGGNGVTANSNSGTGLYATSVSGNGILGKVSSSATAVYGYNQSYGTAVYAYSHLGQGLNAESDNADAIYANSYGADGADISGENHGVIGRSDVTPLAASDLDGNYGFYVDSTGDVYYTGSLNALSLAARGTKVHTFGPKSATPTVEDSGTAQLTAGAAAIRLDPTFASSIDPQVAYRVFVTPSGDTNGLYIAQKTPAGFIVRENRNGRSTVAFDYRIVATALGAAGQRMSVAGGPLLPPANQALLAKLRARPALALPPRN